MSYYVQDRYTWDETLDEPSESATIKRSTKTDKIMSSGNSYVDLIFRLDSQQEYTTIERSNWFEAIGNIGGMQTFIYSIVHILFSEFTGIDFLSTLINMLYLKK